MALSVNFINMQLFVLLSFSYSTLINLFDTGTFRLGWSEAVIQPIHKKEDINSPDNYRGISLLNVSGKLYNYILNNMAEDNGVFCVCFVCLFVCFCFCLFVFVVFWGCFSVCSDLEPERMDYTPG